MTSSQHRIVHLAETGSTNADAMRFALAGEALPLWVTAERQTSGRGRAGRVWSSEPGNLHASLAFLPGAPLHHAGELSLLAGIALIDAIRSISPLAEMRRLRLKWPNDVLIGPAKAGGILVETTTARGQPSFQEGQGFLAVIGFGLNVASCPDDIGRAATALAREEITTTPAAVLDALASHSAEWIGRWDDGRAFEAIRQAWMARAGMLGEAITINTASGPVAATYEGLDATGALLAGIGGRVQTITYGDVALIAPIGEGTEQ